MYVIAIDVEKCQGCGDCVETCPGEVLAIAEEGGKKYAMVKGNPDDCLGCFSCQETCEEGAITVTEV